MKPKKSLFSRNGQAAAFVTAVTFCVTGHAFAADYDWNAAAADFNNPANWSIGGIPAAAVPGATDTANVANGGNAQWSTNAPKTVAELRAGNGAAGSISISGGSTFTTTSALVGRQNAATTGTLTVSGAGTILNVTTGNTHVGTVSTAIGTTGAGATGVLNINSGAIYRQSTPDGNDSFIIGNNTAGQSGAYKGTLNVDNATLEVLNGSRLYIAQTAGSVGEVNVTNNGIINVTDDWLIVGRGGSGKLTLASGTITKAGGNNFSVGDLAGTGVVDHTGGTLAITGGEFFVGLGGGTTGTYNLGTGATVTVNNWSAIGRSGGTGILNLNGGTLTKTGGGNFMVGARDGGVSTGTVNQSGGTLDVVGGELWLGQNANDANGKSAGTYNLNGGSVNVNNWIGVGREGGNGTLNVSGGTLTKTGGAGNHVVLGQGNSTNTGILNITGGLVDLKFGELWVSENSAGQAKITAGVLNVPAIQVARIVSAYSGLLQLQGGTLNTGRIYGGAGTANVEFDGTTINATGNQAAFIDNLDTADIKAGRLLINSNGFNLGVPQVLTGTGTGTAAGVTKTGAGTLSLLGANTYAGTTLVNGGKVITTTASLSTGAVTVANTAGFGVNLLAADQKIQPSAVTLGESTLDFDLGGVYDQAQPTLDVTGALTLSGGAETTVVNISTPLSNSWVTGTYPLIRYGTLGGTGFPALKLGTLPLGMTATLVHNVGTKKINLSITRLAITTWLGIESNVWNTTDDNWFNQLGSGSKFADGDPVFFNDDAESSALDIQIPGTVIPGSVVTFANEAKNFSLNGAGKISGTSRLLKQGVGTVTINNTNTLTGGVRIEKGSIIIGSLSNGGGASPIGAAAVAPANLVLAGGTLSFTGASTTTNRGFSVGALDGAIEVTNAASNLTFSGSLASTAGGLVKKGPGTLTLTGSGAIGTDAPARVEAGKLALNGAGTVTAGEIWVGNTPGAPASLDVTSGTFTANSWMAVGRGNGSTGNVSNVNISGGAVVTVTNLSTGFAGGLENNSATQNITIAGSTFNNTAQTLIAESRGSITNITATGNSTLNTREIQVALGGGAPVGATAATITLQDTAVWNVGTAANIAYASVGRDGGTGNLIVKNSAQFLNYDDFSLGEAGSSTGTLTIQDSANVAVRTALLGRGADSTAVITQSGGTFSNRGDNNFQIGVNGDTTFNLSGGGVTANGYTSVARFGPSTSSLSISGGTYTQTAADRNILIGEEGNGTLTVSGTGTLQANGGLRVGFAATGVGALSQTGGTINVATNVILGDNGKATVNLSGGQFNMNTAGTVNFVVGNFGTGQATLNISGTADLRLMNNASLRVGNESTTANNTVTQTGGTVTSYSDNGTTVGGTGVVVLGRLTASGQNTYDLAGGTLTTGAIRSEASTSKLIFNGGTLKASGDNATFVSGLTSVEVAGGAVIDSNAHNVTIVSALTQAGAGGLIKNGAGTLTLAGVNTYVGSTVINAGGVTLADDAQLRFLLGANGVSNSVSGTGTATFNGDFNIARASAAIANGNSWTLVAGPVNETYGASFNVVGFTKSGTTWTLVEGANTWTFSQATGVLTLTTSGVADPYTTWTSAFFPGVTDQNIIGRTADPDGDGSSNALEFALGGAPNSGADGPKVYNLQADGSVDADTDKELLLTIAVRAATPAFEGSPSPTATKDGAIYTIQGSLDLTGFNVGVTSVAVVAPATAPTAPTGYEYRTFSLNGSNNLTGKGFLRVKVN